MTEQQIGELLRRGADDVPAPDFAAAALKGARRHRRRRNAVVGGVVVAAAAAVITAPFALRDAPSTDRNPPASETVAPRAIAAPAPEQSVVQPLLDPDTIASLPELDTDLPKELVPDPAAAVPLTENPLDKALVVSKSFQGDQSVFYALGADRVWRSVPVDAPADLGGGRGPLLVPESLSPDGRTVVLKGSTAVYLVDLSSGDTTAVRTPTRSGVIAWQPDSEHLLISNGTSGTLLDATTGDQVPAPYAVDTYSMPFLGTYAPDGTLIHGADTTGGNDHLVERDGGTEKVDVAADNLGQAPYLLASDDSLVMSTYPMIGTGAGSRGSHRGLLLVDRENYEARAFLPLAGDDLYYFATDRLRPRAWLDDHTVLFSIRPEGAGGDDIDGVGQFLLAWDVKTGEVRRVAQTTNNWNAFSLAVG